MKLLIATIFNNDLINCHRSKTNILRSNTLMTIHEKLDTLYQLLIDDYKTLKAEIIELIAHPEENKNTHKFGLLLSDLKDSDFFMPLQEKLLHTTKGDSWLLNYLYAATELLRDADQNFPLLDGLTDKLEDWVLNGNDELAMYASGFLRYAESKHAEEIQLKKLEQKDVFFLIHVDCLLGLLDYNKEKHIHLLQEIIQDETRNADLKEFCQNYLEQEE